MSNTVDADWGDVEAITALIYTAANCASPDVADSTYLLLELLKTGQDVSVRKQLPDWVPTAVAVQLLSTFPFLPEGPDLVTVAAALTLHCPLPPPPRERLPHAAMSDMAGVPPVPLDALLALVSVMGGGSSHAKLQLGFWALDRDGNGTLSLGDLMKAVPLVPAVGAAASLILTHYSDQPYTQAAQAGGQLRGATAAAAAAAAVGARLVMPPVPSRQQQQERQQLLQRVVEAAFYEACPPGRAALSVLQMPVLLEQVAARLTAALVGVDPTMPMAPQQQQRARVSRVTWDEGAPPSSTAQGGGSSSQPVSRQESLSSSSRPPPPSSGISRFLFSPFLFGSRPPSATAAGAGGGGSSSGPGHGRSNSGGSFISAGDGSGQIHPAAGGGAAAAAAAAAAAGAAAGVQPGPDGVDGEDALYQTAVSGLQLRRDSSSAFSSAVDAAEAAAAGGAVPSSSGGAPMGLAAPRQQQQQQQGVGPKVWIPGTAEGWASARTSLGGGGTTWDPASTMPMAGSVGPRLTAAQQELNRTAAQYITSPTPTSPLAGPPGRPSATDTLGTPGAGDAGDEEEDENVGVTVHSAAVTVGMGVCLPCSAMFLVLLTLIIGDATLIVWAARSGAIAVEHAMALVLSINLALIVLLLVLLRLRKWLMGRRNLLEREAGVLARVNDIMTDFGALLKMLKTAAMAEFAANKEGGGEGGELQGPAGAYPIQPGGSRRRTGDVELGGGGPGATPGGAALVGRLFRLMQMVGKAAGVLPPEEGGPARGGGRLGDSSLNDSLQLSRRVPGGSYGSQGISATGEPPGVPRGLAATSGGAAGGPGAEGAGPRTARIAGAPHGVLQMSPSVTVRQAYGSFGEP